MTRRPDWPVRLAAIVEDARARPFAWGVHDCASFAANAVHAIRGDDPMATFRGQYRSALGALRVMRRWGGLVNAANRLLGEPIRALDARPGDVLLSCGAHGPSLGVCVDTRGAFVSASGLALIRVLDCEQAWRV